MTDESAPPEDRARDGRSDEGGKSPARGDKRYDRAYFDRWYRGDEPAVGTEDDLRRAVALAVSAAESIIARPLETVLDVGCGEGRWQPVLRDLRPEASYLGIDSSEYAVERFGETRNLRRGRFGELGYHVFDEPFDLVICSDVLHYLSSEEILAGIDALADRTGGVAVVDIFTEEDDPEGDRVDFHRRPAAWYRRVLAGAGLVPVGLQMYVHREVAGILESLDLPEWAPGDEAADAESGPAEMDEEERSSEK